jgi:uncharacterized membrane protein YoaK (UPF0700 family)
MHRYDPSRQKLALGLAFLAGQVDATGFIVAGGYFTSFMSGNTTRLGVDLLENPAVAWFPVALIASFVGGVVLGAMLVPRSQDRPKSVLLTVVTCVLGLAVLALAKHYEVLFLALAAAAMGVSNNVFSRDGEVTVGVTYMTGALVRSGQGLAARLQGKPDTAMRGYPALWLALACGAASGALLSASSSPVAIATAFGFSIVLSLYARRIETRST